MDCISSYLNKTERLSNYNQKHIRNTNNVKLAVITMLDLKNINK